MVVTIRSLAKLVGKEIATGLDDGSIYVWDVQDGRKIRQVMLNSSPQGPISCLNWIGEDQKSQIANSENQKELDVEFDVERYLPRVKAIGRKYLSQVIVSKTGSDTIKLNDDSLGERRTLGGNAGKTQAVDMVFVGSESGHLELRYVLCL